MSRTDFCSHWKPHIREDTHGRQVQANLKRLGPIGKFILVLSGLLALYELLIASRLLTWFGFFLPAVQHRGITLFFVILIIYSLRTASGKAREGALAWYDLIPVVVGMICAGFVAFNYDAIIDYSTYGYLDTKGIILTVCLALVLLESVRRLAGLALPLIILFFIAITYFQNYLPGILYGKGYPLDRLGILHLCRDRRYLRCALRCGGRCPHHVHHLWQVDAGSGSQPLVHQPGDVGCRLDTGRSGKVNDRGQRPLRDDHRITVHGGRHHREHVDSHDDLFGLQTQIRCGC